MVPFCWEGTETADWNAETVFKPIACPKAVYCLGGITKEDAERANRFLEASGHEAWNTRLERRVDGAVFRP